MTDNLLTRPDGGYRFCVAWTPLSGRAAGLLVSPDSPKGRGDGEHMLPLPSVCHPSGWQGLSKYKLTFDQIPEFFFQIDSLLIQKFRTNRS